MKKTFSIFFFSNIIMALVLIITYCNNPFSTREPQKPGSEGAAIKPANSPENVLYNLEASFEGLSIQDYIDVFSDDFVFNPDPEDSLKYQEDFINGWNLEKEKEFANNFLQRQNFTSHIEGNPIYLDASIEPGQDKYEYRYNMFILKADSTETDFYKIEIEGEAWLYFREDSEGNWSVYQWIDYRLHKNSVTWGALRAQNI